MTTRGAGSSVQAGGRLVLTTVAVLALVLPVTAASATAAVREARPAHAARHDVPTRSRVTAIRGSLSNRARIAHLDGDHATLRKVRVGRHDGFDRLVFEFAGRGSAEAARVPRDAKPTGGLPGYSVRYVPVARTDGLGAPIATQGAVALQVYLAADSVALEPDGAELTFTPARPITPRYPTLRQVRYGGFFEGGTTFGVGLTGRSGFRVVELSGPPRLAIDVAHGARLRNLRGGDRGSDVRDWQSRLNTVQFGAFATSPGHPQGRLTVDGRFGPATARATRTFQRAEGVAGTGVVDAATRGAMYLALRRSAQRRG
jgi:hypothetical protein